MRTQARRAQAGIDPRLLQIGVLSGLLCIQIGLLDFAATQFQAAVTIGSTVATEALACRLLGRRFDWRSPFITGLSLSLLLRSHEPAVWAGAGLLGIGAKHLLRVGGKHLFNPACFGIVAMLLSGAAWVSPGQWGALAWSALLLGGCGALVLARARRADTAAAFLAAYGGLVLARGVWLGDPWSIPVHQLQSGSLLVFGLFMITDPRTTPDARACRLVFACAVAALAYQLQFNWQVREGLFFALAAAAPLTPLLDRLSRSRTPEFAPCALAVLPSPLPSSSALG